MASATASGVEAARSALADQVISAREIRVAQPVAHVARSAVGVQVELGGRRARRRSTGRCPRSGRRRSRRPRSRAGRPRRRAAARGRATRCRSAPAPRTSRGRCPARRPRARCSAQGRTRAARRSRQKEVGVIAAGRELARVDRRDAPAGRADDHEAASADPARVGLDHAEHAGGGHGGVDRVAALAQHGDRGAWCRAGPPIAAAPPEPVAVAFAAARRRRHQERKGDQ